MNQTDDSTAVPNLGEDFPQGCHPTHAICHFRNGQTRRLPIISVTADEIHLITMQPPCTGEAVQIQLSVSDNYSAQVCKSIVVAESYFPSDATQCGFVAITAQSDASFIPVAQLSSQTPNSRSVTGSAPAPKTKRYEKRMDPRVDTQIDIRLEIPGRSIKSSLQNLSMSGALLSVDKYDFPREIDLDSLIWIHVVETHQIPAASIKAEVIRLIGIGRPDRLGVRFIDLNPDTLTTIENLILFSILKSDDRPSVLLPQNP